MAKIKRTKNELKKQKDDLKRFTRFLPMLELKKLQLLQEIHKIQNDIVKIQGEIEWVEKEVNQWVDVFADDIDLSNFIKVKEIATEAGNVAGIAIPLFREVIFEDIAWDFFKTPLWIDKGIAVCKEQIIRNAERQIAERQQEILQEELRVTVQRIKLFEEFKIPETKESIRIIQIFLGDQQTAEVVRGKIAKKKIQARRQQAGWA
jgi:V/A-type H+-transporting ATPase subunit D